MREAKRLARQGLPHPDPVVRAAVVARQRRWFRLAWYPTILACLCMLAAPVFLALAWAQGNPLWFGAAPLAMTASALIFLVAFGVWVTGLRSGWLAAPNLPQVPPAPLPLRVPASLPRSPVALLFLSTLVMAVEWIVIAITVEQARVAAAGMLPSFVISLAPALLLVFGLRQFGPQVIIEEEGVRIPMLRAALAWEQVAEIRSFHGPVAGLAILPVHHVTLPWWARLSWQRPTPWLLIADAMMATPVETVVSTAIHARNARLQQVGATARH